MHVPRTTFEKNSSLGSLKCHTSPCFDEDDGCWWNFREIYEHPFSKFINHSTWYMVFLVFVILNSMQQSFATRLMGLEWIGMSLYFYFLIGDA